MNLAHQEEYMEKRSRFIAFLYVVKDDEEFRSAFEAVRAQHPKARHILRCGRFLNRFGVPVLTSSEDKEPISSMKRLSGLFEKKDIVGYGVFIVRYFGGTKLGASHLDRVYFGLGANLLSYCL